MSNRWNAPTPLPRRADQKLPIKWQRRAFYCYDRAIELPTANIVTTSSRKRPSIQIRAEYVDKFETGYGIRGTNRCTCRSQGSKEKP